MEQLRSSSEAEEPAFPYVLAQAEVRLRELDPNAAPSTPSFGGPGGALPPGLEGIDPAVLEQLRQQLGAAGGGAGGGE